MGDRRLTIISNISQHCLDDRRLTIISNISQHCLDDRRLTIISNISQHCLDLQNIFPMKLWEKELQILTRLDFKKNNNNMVKTNVQTSPESWKCASGRHGVLSYFVLCWSVMDSRVISWIKLVQRMSCELSAFLNLKVVLSDLPWGLCSLTFFSAVAIPKILIFTGIPKPWVWRSDCWDVMFYLFPVLYK